jgi:hypothetical protein
MAGKINNAFELSQQSWNALLKNKQLIMFPVISMIGMIFVTVLFIIPEAFLVWPIIRASDTNSDASLIQWVIALVVLFIYYLAAYFVVIFSNTALVGATMKIIRGEPATVSDGITIARTHLGKILVYALISATVGVLAKVITSSGRRSKNFLVMLFTAIIGGLIQGAWELAVFFAIPIIVAEDVNILDSLKRSLALFKQTWGESVLGSVAVGGISCLAYLVVILISGAIILAGMFLGQLPLTILGFILLIFGFVLVSVLNGAVNGIFQASLYNYAVTGNAGPFIDTNMAREAFSG